MNKKNIIIAVVILLIAALSAWYIVSNDGLKDNQSVDQVGFDSIQVPDVVAVVNEQEILGEQYKELQSQLTMQLGINPSSLNEKQIQDFKDQVVDTLVSQEIIAQQAIEDGITVTEEQINQQINLIKSNFESEEQFQLAIEEQNLSEEKIRETLKNDLLVQNYFEQEIYFSNIKATEEEVEAAYQEVSQTTPDIPALDEVYEQIEQTVLGQKQQQLVMSLVEQLKEEAEIEILF